MNNNSTSTDSMPFFPFADKRVGNVKLSFVESDDDRR